MMSDSDGNTKLVPAICTQCGGQIEVDSTQEKAVCNYCGTSFFVEKAISNYSVQHANIQHVEAVNIHNNKRGTVESVLNFVEKQQGKKQKKIDDEKRRIEEEKKKQEEQRKKIMNQIFNKNYRKRNLGIFAAIVIVFFVIIVIGSMKEEVNHDGEALTPGGLSYMQGKDYKDVVADFQENGFLNVKTEILDDLVTGWLIKDGEVETVTVDGDSEFTANGWYPNDVEVVITYHTFPSDDSEDSNVVSTNSSDRNVSGYDENTNQLITWCGIDFSVPTYFDVLDESSTENWTTYYPGIEEYYSSLMFQSQEFLGTQEAFNSQISSIADSTLNSDFLAYAEIQDSESIMIAGMPGWIISFSVLDAEDDGVSSRGKYSFVYNKAVGKIAMITCIYDIEDQSKYDYLGDYMKILDSATLIDEQMSEQQLSAEPLDLNAINNTNISEADAEFVGKYYKVSGEVNIAYDPSEGYEAMIIIQPDVMAKGMNSTIPLEINIWLSEDTYQKIGGSSSVGSQVELPVKLLSISRNAISNDSEVKGYPIQLVFGE